MKTKQHSTLASASLPKLIAFILLFSQFVMNAQTVIGESVDYANPLSYKIAGISVVGAEYTDVQAIKLFSGLQEGDEIMIPGDKITDAIRKLWKQRLFSNVGVYVAEFRGNEAFLVISLKESPRMSKYEINGIRKSEADNIREKIDLKSGTISNENVKNNAIAVIKDYYTEKGYFNARVKVRERDDMTSSTDNDVILSFDVIRGDRVKIERIELEGSGIALEKKQFLFLESKTEKPVMSDRAIKKAMKETKERRWYRVFKSSKYIEEKYEEDKQKIIARYNKEGFRNAKIISDSVYVINDERIGIKLKIEEDKRFYFRNITFVGNTKYTSTRLDSVLNISRGEIYNVELLESRLNFNPQGVDVSSLYTDDGYLSYFAFPVETLVEPDSIDIEVRMSEGKQFRIGKVSIIGNTKTNDHVIFREIRTRPGELFSRSDIIRTQRELASLGYFNQEGFDVRTNPRQDEGLVDLTYVLEEKPNDQIQLSGGWGGGRVVGSLSLSFTNFSMRNFFKKEAWSPLPTGDGQRLSVSASSNGAFFQSYNMSFTEPWLGGKKPNSLSFSVSKSRQTNGLNKKLKQSDIDASTFLQSGGFEAGDANPNLQELKVIGGSVSYGRRLQKPDDYFLFYGGISYQNFKLNNYGSFFGNFKNGDANNLALNGTLTRSSTSDPIYPTYGSTVTLTGKFTPPYKFLGEKLGNKTYDYDNMSIQDRYKLVEYYKIKFTAHWYTALNKHKERKFVLHTNLGVGFLGAYNQALGQSPFERFYLGGVYLSGYLLDGREIVNLRGYDDLSLTKPNSGTGAPAIAKYSMELRYPLSTNPSATIFALGFAEAGNTWSDLRSFNPYDVYRSAGIGLRIFLPMFGLLGFDYGWRLNDVPNNPQMAKGQFHFSIGMNLGEL
jgi:outer membrane protein insertion porin family